MWHPFYEYDNEEIIGAVNPPKPHFESKNYVANGSSEDVILKVEELKLSGVIIFAKNFQEDKSNRKIQCSFDNLKGKFKIILITDDNEIVTIFNSEVQESDEVISVEYMDGNNELRIIGSKLDVENLLISYF